MSAPISEGQCFEFVFLLYLVQHADIYILFKSLCFPLALISMYFTNPLQSITFHVFHQNKPAQRPRWNGDMVPVGLDSTV